MNLTAVFEKVPEGYIAFVEELPGANAQGKTLDEARENLREAVELVVEANRQVSEELIRGKSPSLHGPASSRAQRPLGRQDLSRPRRAGSVNEAASPVIIKGSGQLLRAQLTR